MGLFDPVALFPAVNLELILPFSTWNSPAFRIGHCLDELDKWTGISINILLFTVKYLKKKQNSSPESKILRLEDSYANENCKFISEIRCRMWKSNINLDGKKKNKIFENRNSGLLANEVEK